MFRQDRQEGALLGLAFGDVFGAPIESWTSEEITQIYGAYSELPSVLPFSKIYKELGLKRLEWVRPLGFHTDDTQQAMALLRVVLTRQGWDEEHLRQWRAMLVRGSEAKAWRDTGHFFRGAVEKLAKPSQDLYGAASTTAGIGAAMRTGPLGAIYTEDMEALRKAAYESSLLTHGDVRAASIAYAAAWTVAQFILGKSPAEVRTQLPQELRSAEEAFLNDPACAKWSCEREHAHQVSLAFSQVFSRSYLADSTLVQAVLVAAQRITGKAQFPPEVNGAFSLHGGVFAIASAIISEYEPKKLLSTIVSHGSDTDTVAAIAGSILGARYGTSWIPVDRLRDAARIQAYAKAIHSGALPDASDEAFLAVESKLTAESVGYPAEKKKQLGIHF